MESSRIRVHFVRIAAWLATAILCTNASAQASAVATDSAAVAATNSLIEAYRKECPGDVAKQPPVATKSSTAGTRSAVDSFFSYENLASDVMAPVSKALVPRQRARLHAALSTLLMHTARIGGNAFCKGTPTLSAPTTHPRGTEVACTLLEPGEDVPSTFSFVWAQRPAGLRVIDLLVEGASLIGDYQGQLVRIRDKEGNGGLLRRIEARAQAIAKPAKRPAAGT